MSITRPVPLIRSIPFKIIAPLSVAGLLLACAARFVVGDAAERELNDRLWRRAQIAAHSLAQAAECVSYLEDLRRLVTAGGAEPDVLSIVIAGGRPMTIAASTSMLMKDAPLREIGDGATIRAIEKAIESQRDWGHFDESHARMTFSSPLRANAVRGGFDDGAVAVVVDARPTREAVLRWERMVTISLVSAIILAVATAAFLVTRHVNRPIALITSAARRRARGEGAIDAPIIAADEIGNLAHALNAANAAGDKAVRETTLLNRAIDLSAMVCVTDADGRIVSVNRNFVETSGYAESELIGKTHRIVRSDEHSSDFFADMWSAIGAGRIWRGEVRNRRADGTTYWAESTIVPSIGAGGAVEKYTSIQFDVTDRKNVEAALIAARDAAESANRAKSDFLATMSHEIRTPMNGIVGFNELLLDSALDEHQRRCAEAIGRSAETLLAIINDILDFSKLEAGKLLVEKVRFDAKSAAKDVTALLEIEAKKRGIECLLEWDKAAPNHIMGDPLRFRQILLNLAGNAIKFTKSGFIHIRAQCEGSAFARFEIEDTGIGMSPETCARLFTKFMQADSSTTRRYGGTGLGLAIAKQLVTLMGGKIGVRSSLGHGSTFWFTLPVGVAVEDGRTPISATIPAAALDRRVSARVLVAEDDSTNAEIARHVLEKAGCRVTIVGDGKLVVDEIKNAEYDVVLMDCRMPNVDGYEATAIIRSMEAEAEKRCRLPIVALTANAVDGDRTKCIEAGMDDYIAKPFRSADLLATIGRWVPAATLTPRSGDDRG